MLSRTVLRILTPVIGVCLFSASGFAQNASSVCGVAPVADEHAQANIFSAQQEEWPGEAMADAVEREDRPVSDTSLNAHLQMIVDKLAQHLPPTQIKFRAVLVDSSEVNGYSLAGGRIYLTRKLAAAAQNDDELAAVLGHEMGHIASHQFAFETTRDLKRLLNVTSIGDKTDVYAKFQTLMDARMKDKNPQPSGDDDAGQDEADKIGTYAISGIPSGPCPRRLFL